MADRSEYYLTSGDLSLYGGALNGRTEWINAWWDDAEPSYKNVEFEETCVEMFYSENKGQWVLNDVVDGFLMDQEYLSGKVGYIVEYEN